MSVKNQVRLNVDRQTRQLEVLINFYVIIPVEWKLHNWISLTKGFFNLRTWALSC